MKTNSQTYDQKTKDFIDRQMSSEVFVLEIICLTIFATVAVKWVSRIFIAMFSRSIYVDTREYKKVVISGQHLLPPKRN